MSRLINELIPFFSGIVNNNLEKGSINSKAISAGRLIKLPIRNKKAIKTSRRIFNG
jgi:hypothetical protein